MQYWRCYENIFRYDLDYPARQRRIERAVAENEAPKAEFATMGALSSHQLSTLIGAIYDCTLDPDRWTRVLRDIASELACILSMIYLVELQEPKVRFVKAWNYDVSSMLQNDYGGDLVQLINQPFVMTQSIDEPFSTARLMGYESVRDVRYWQEVASPGGHVDSLQTILVRNPSCIGIFSAVRHESVGFSTDEDLDRLRLLAPHIRRAVTISNLLDLRTLETQALTETLDRIAMGIVVVAENGRVVFANEVARQMFVKGDPITSRNGRLGARHRAANQELSLAIRTAQADEHEMGSLGIGISLGLPDSTPVFAHVLPLCRGHLRASLMPQAVAAVFIAPSQEYAARDFDMLAETYQLTPAESRIFKLIVEGSTLGDVTETLRISQATAKTHLAQIFAKTQVSRQADLIALAHKSAIPLRADRKRSG